MTFDPVDFLLAFAQVTHQIASEADRERAEHAETQTLARNLRADLDDTKGRLVNAQVVNDRLERELIDTLRLVDRLRDEAKQEVAPLRDGPRPHLGPAARCWCDVTHDPKQTAALNDGRDRIEAQA